MKEAGLPKFREAALIASKMKHFWQPRFYICDPTSGCISEFISHSLLQWCGMKLHLP